MSERINEILLVTNDADGSAHIAPMGLRWRGEICLLAPFRPSRTLDNLLRDRHASINTTDDVRLYAGCLTGRRDWPTQRCTRIACTRLSGALSHREVEVVRVEQDEQRPQFLCRTVHIENHRPFAGYNRAQAAVLELAILVSRLDRLPDDKIDSEIAYLQIAIDKTAGAEEREAWRWLLRRVEEHRARACA
ncbi:MAG: DUF447 family protein [Chromatiaceae bacterium]|nr:DUF447 family protein [Chromatiaceae bacterium]MCP5314247.1 DUF447 family protein [Chromatiaceae bacterium]